MKYNSKSIWPKATKIFSFYDKEESIMLKERGVYKLEQLNDNDFDIVRKRAIHKIKDYIIKLRYGRLDK